MSWRRRSLKCKAPLLSRIYETTIVRNVAKRCNIEIFVLQASIILRTEVFALIKFLERRL